MTIDLSQTYSIRPEDRDIYCEDISLAVLVRVDWRLSSMGGRVVGTYCPLVHDGEKFLPDWSNRFEDIWGVVEAHP